MSKDIFDDLVYLVRQRIHQLLLPSDLRPEHDCEVTSSSVDTDGSLATGVVAKRAADIQNRDGDLGREYARASGKLDEESDVV